MASNGGGGFMGSGGRGGINWGGVARGLWNFLGGGGGGGGGGTPTQYGMPRGPGIDPYGMPAGGMPTAGGGTPAGGGGVGGRIWENPELWTSLIGGGASIYGAYQAGQAEDRAADIAQQNYLAQQADADRARDLDEEAMRRQWAEVEAERNRRRRVYAQIQAERAGRLLPPGGG